MSVRSKAASGCDFAAGKNACRSVSSGFAWLGSGNGQSKTIAQYVRKGAGYHYPLGRLLQGEPEWEAKLVEELENEFADIRKQIDLLGKIRDSIHSYCKAKQPS